MNSTLKIILRFIVLVFLQVTIFNYVNFLGYINPYIYVLFLVLFPLRNNKSVFIISAFLLGLSVDMFSDTGGIHAGASVFVAYIRPIISKFSFGTLNEMYSVKFNSVEFSKRLTYITLIVANHHLMVYFLEFFNFSHILTILKYTFLSGIFSITLIFLITFLFSSKNK